MNKYGTIIMTDNNVADLHLVKFHIKQECVAPNINIENVDYEEIIKMETEVVGGSWLHQNVEEVLQNENEDQDLELGNAVEQMLNKNSGKVCENCSVEYQDYCMNCEHLIHIFDNEMKIGSFSRAMRSIPHNILNIKGSLMEGYGVYAIRNIPKGVKFGPYEGLETVKRSNKCVWKIKYLKLVEADGEDYCNWMRFINCATTQTEQNLTALQCMGKIYYKTSRQIKIGEELLIYYSNSGCDHLELTSIQYFQPDIEQINENIFKCPPCCFGYAQKKYLMNHNRICPYKKKQIIEVNSSIGGQDTENHTETCEIINNIGLNRQKDHENEEAHEKIGLAREGKVLEQDCTEHMKKNDKVAKNKSKFPDGYYDHLTTGSLKKQPMVHQKKCYEKNVTLNAVKGEKQKCKHSVYLCKPTKESSLLPNGKKYESNYKANKLTLKKYECSYTSVQTNHSLSRIDSHHTMEKSYRCNECSYGAVRKDALLYHIKSQHTMKKPYKCNECSYASVVKHGLLSHIKSHHTIEKPYKCNECSYAAGRNSCLLSHIKSQHTMEKPYKCTECSYAAVRRDYLVSHIKSYHAMEKPFNCNECSFGAIRKDTLLYHIKSQHRMEKPYKCSECSYAAVLKRNLLLHIQTHHTMEKPYKCNECSYAAARKDCLLSHIKNIHSMKKP